MIFSSFPLFTQGQDSSRLKLMFIGDIMQHDRQIESAYINNSTYDYTPNFIFVKPIIESADFVIANLELTLAGPPYKGYPRFSAPDELAAAISHAGIDFLVTANNHSLDRYKDGLERTIDALDSLGILHTGTFKDSLSKAQSYPFIHEVKGFRIGLGSLNGLTFTADYRLSNNFIIKPEIRIDQSDIAIFISSDGMNTTQPTIGIAFIGVID